MHAYKLSWILLFTFSIVDPILGHNLAVGNRSRIFGLNEAESCFMLQAARC